MRSAPLVLGPLAVWPPVVLAPMAGITDAPFRTLCRRQGGGLFVSEMLHAREWLAGNARSDAILAVDPDERPRSVQLYGTDADALAEATRRLVGDEGVDHVDLNFGCPVRKVTASGGGAAVPARPRLLARLVRAVVGAAGDVPVTIKLRAGIDEEHLTYRSSGTVAADEGCAAIGLHARTAAQLYDGDARWEWIADLKARSTIPVLGNGDIWIADDARRMVEATGCDGVIVGRGCLGRPWLFRDLAALFDGRPPEPRPRLGAAAAALVEHARALEARYGAHAAALRIRKFGRWYLGDYPGTGPAVGAIARVTHPDELAPLVAALDPDLEAPPEAARRPRGKRPGRQRVSLPPGWLDDPRADTAPADGATAEGG